MARWEKGRRIANAEKLLRMQELLDQTSEPISHYIYHHSLPLSIVQKQVGHRSLRSTSVYLNPSEETVAAAYSEAQAKAQPASQGPATGYEGNL